MLQYNQIKDPKTMIDPNEIGTMNVAKNNPKETVLGNEFLQWSGQHKIHYPRGLEGSVSQKLEAQKF